MTNGSVGTVLLDIPTITELNGLHMQDVEGQILWEVFE